MQYDTRVEEAFIARATEEREVSSIRQQQQQEDSPANAPSPISATSSPTEAAEVVEPSSSQAVDPAPVPNPVSLSSVNSRGEQARSAFGLINGSSILTPTPIAAMSAGGGLTKGGTSGSALHNIDLKDFETEQDPFENLSLRVINDREELNKVFHVTTAPSSVTPVATSAAKPDPRADTQSSSLLQYDTADVANGVNTASLNFVSCQPVPRWPVASHNLTNTCSPMTRQQYSPNVGRVSGPDRTNFPVTGMSYYGSSNFQPAATSMLRSARSTPDISRLVDDRAMANARRTPPPLSSNWSSVLDSQNQEKVRHCISFQLSHNFVSQQLQLTATDYRHGFESC